MGFYHGMVIVDDISLYGQGNAAAGCGVKRQ
jgi:hypothetical protein